MITTPFYRLSFALIFGISSVHAATLAHFDFAGGSLNHAASPISGLMVTKLASDSAFLSFTSSSGWESAAQISGAANFFTPSTHAAAGNAITFTITAMPGFRFSLEGFSFLARSTGMAPGDVGFRIGPHHYDFSDTYSNQSAITNISKSSLGLTELDSATISIQGWNSSGSSALQLDNLVLTGAVVPEPSMFMLCLLGALPLLQRRR